MASDSHTSQSTPRKTGSYAPRIPGPERRLGILAAAHEEFAQRGYYGASVRRIAEQADCSEPLVYKMFGDKQQLFAALLDHIAAAMEAAIDRALNAPGDPLENWIAFLEHGMASEDYARMVRFRMLAITVDEPTVQAALAAGMDRMRERVQVALARAVELGTVNADFDAEYVAWMWLGITLAASFRDGVGAPGGFQGMHAHAVTFLRSLQCRSFEPGPGISSS